METQLKIWAGKIDEFTTAAQESKGWARIDLRQRIDDLKVRRALVRANLDAFKAAGSHGRPGLRTALKGAWRDLEDAFREMNL